MKCEHGWTIRWSKIHRSILQQNNDIGTGRLLTSQINIQRGACIRSCQHKYLKQRTCLSPLYRHARCSIAEHCESIGYCARAWVSDRIVNEAGECPSAAVNLGTDSVRASLHESSNVVQRRSHDDQQLSLRLLAYRETSLLGLQRFYHLQPMAVRPRKGIVKNAPPAPHGHRVYPHSVQVYTSLTREIWIQFRRCEIKCRQL